ncbi:putative ribosomal protein [Podospora appendiculata]|uniref:Large ribosomal subunit protein uL30m n=1 Tax=Podospora appendiculata TaxID=314037 RepID=A0AAE0X3T9_9PEZI|nr:putative ribosomal protein [Podospora appendiculata]
MSAYFRITLHRSAIGLPKRTNGVLMGLGLRKRNQVVFHPVEPQFAGMIMKVKELVRVEAVDRALTKAELRAERRPDPGFYVERPRAEAQSGLALAMATARASGEAVAEVEEVRL